MKKIRAALLGAGARGFGSYGPYATRHPQRFEFVAVAEPDPGRRERFAKEHNIPAEHCYESWEELLAQPQMCEAMLICTQDQMHYEPTKQALEKGYHVLLEKPISPVPQECIELAQLAQEKQRVLMICHVLRYTAFFSAIKNIIDQGRLGRIISVSHHENVGYWHQAHSFVRGSWRNSKESSPMILAKSCHDMDILLYLIGGKCTRISSFGDLTFFKAENAPEGAAKRCLDCPIESKCAYSACKLYLTDNTDWPTNVISLDTSLQARIEALRTGLYGRCVFHCDNDVVDHQVTNMEFSNGVTATFTMCAFSKLTSRTLKIMGTEGELRATTVGDKIQILPFLTGQIEDITIPPATTGHGGGDEGIMERFLLEIERGCNSDDPITSPWISAHSHMMAFGAEESRVSGKVLGIEEFTKQFK